MSMSKVGKVEGTASTAAKRRKEIEIGQVLFELNGQEKAPLKDFCYLKVTTEGVIWRKWPINPRNLTQPLAASPSEVILSAEEYLDASSVQTYATAVFGTLVARRIFCALGGSWLLKLQAPVLIHILSFLHLKELFYLSQVCRALRKICLSEQMWENIYYVHLGEPSLQVRDFASQPEVGWQKVFYMDKLQLQKELSRKRKGSSRPSSQASCKHSESFTFLTQATDH